MTNWLCTPGCPFNVIIINETDGISWIESRPLITTVIEYNPIYTDNQTPSWQHLCKEWCQFATCALVNLTSVCGKELPLQFLHIKVKRQVESWVQCSLDQEAYVACPVSELAGYYILQNLACFFLFLPSVIEKCSAVFSVTVSGWNFFPGLQVPLEGSGVRLCPCLRHTGKPVTQEARGRHFRSRTGLTGQSYLTKQL